jgi:hypothetical protein
MRHPLPRQHTSKRRVRPTHRGKGVVHGFEAKVFAAAKTFASKRWCVGCTLRSLDGGTLIRQFWF